MLASVGALELQVPVRSAAYVLDCVDREKQSRGCSGGLVPPFERSRAGAVFHMPSPERTKKLGQRHAALLQVIGPQTALHMQGSARRPGLGPKALSQIHAYHHLHKSASVQWYTTCLDGEACLVLLPGPTRATYGSCAGSFARLLEVYMPP